jgi:hypothetical protein
MPDNLKAKSESAQREPAQHAVSQRRWYRPRFDIVNIKDTDSPPGMASDASFPAGS